MNNKHQAKRQFAEVEKQFSKEQGLPFSKVLSEKEIRESLEKYQVQYKHRILTPTITIWAFLSQVLEQDSSCRKAAKRVLAFMVANTQKITALSDSAYCQARNRLSECMLQDLVLSVGHKISNWASGAQLWHERAVKVFDGTGLLMADTEANQTQYPQVSGCKVGGGFPIVRAAVLFCLTTGAVLECYLDPFNVNERIQFRRFYPHLHPSDIAMADRGGCSYADIALLLARGVDSVFRLHASKQVDLAQAQELSPGDYVVVWHKPKFYTAKGLTRAEYDALPDTLRVRIVRFTVSDEVSRCTVITLVTSLLDAAIYTKQDLAELYERRWDAELDLRHIKTMLQMEMIECKTPAMVRKSIWVHLLAYNLIRQVMWDAAVSHKVPPLRISFKGTIDTIDTFLPQIIAAKPEDKKLIYQIFLWTVSQSLVPIRKGRSQPRCIKHRRKPFPLLNRPRTQYAEYQLNSCSGVRYTFS